MPSKPDLTSSSFPTAGLSAGRRRWVLVGLLALLHLVLMQGMQSGVGRTLLLVHFGLFILWQPFVRAEQRLGGAQLAVIGLALAGAISLVNAWLMILWVMVLAGIVGGKVFFFTARSARALYLLVLAYLISALLVILVPQVLPGAVLPGDFLPKAAHYGLPLLFPLMALLPLEQEAEDGAEVVDFVYSALVFLILAVLVLGSISVMLLLRLSYIEALIDVIAVLAATLLLMAWAWNPRLGFGGLNVFFSRYLLSIGLPFERWLHELAEHMQRVEEPAKFLEEALAGMSRLPWVVGTEWRAGAARGQSGRLEGRRTEYSHGALLLAIYTRQPLSPALTWHFDLLAQLLADFHEAKLQASELQQLSYVKAIHQTGARLTHDVKNLLQALNALCLAAASEGETPSPQYQALLRRQLPVISQRLQQTLDKLRRPEMEGVQQIPVSHWWQGLQGRYAQAGLEFVPAQVDSEQPIPATLFNSVAENLLENALAKRQATPGIRIRAEFAAGRTPALTVCDSGQPIAAAAMENLFRAPVQSSTGLGIGLYQAARHAEYYGYVLDVERNEPGRVCFGLRRLEGETDEGLPSPY